ncbi:MAG TPA: SDR family NAD(P)-dependent oxidoreductase [Kofleriaceae bacterium]|nr:SDR family NAD(P)-dependent oxidoreductase [Kofleriaceae bacterium]
MSEVRGAGDAPGDRTALVTGASRGLGRETCRGLARSGHRVILTSRDVDTGRAAAEELTGAGHAVEHRQLDVEDPASVAALAAQLSAAGVRLDVLVNNAGIALDGFDAEVARRTVEVNFTGALRVTDALLPLVRDGGAVVMVSSGVGELSSLGPAARARLAATDLTRAALIDHMRAFVDDVAAGRHREAGWPSSAYQVSKAGMNALVRVLAPELARRGIRINAVCPGWVRTDMGGPHATRSLAEGAASVLWAAAVDGPTGGFFRDGKSIPW